MSKKKKVIKAPVKRAFNYTSLCCNEPAKKEPVERSAADFKENKYSECGLGKWHCTKCSRNCKVKRSPVKEAHEGNES
jgi:hypothetical protein